MIVQGYDTDDLTDRQNYVFNQLGRTTFIALSFLSYCVMRNNSLGLFDNYEGDCDYLVDISPDILLEDYGINLDTLYN